MQSRKPLLAAEPTRHPHMAALHQSWRYEKLDKTERHGHEVIMLRLMSQSMAATARALQINQYTKGDTVLLRLEGKLTINTAGQLAAVVMPLLNSTPRTIILDLGRVRDLDASGVGELVSIHTEAHERGSKARFIIPAGRILDMIHLANLECALEIYPDEKSATEGITAH